MALTDRLAVTFAPAELAFLAEETKVTIVPQHTMPAIDLVGARLAEQRPMRRTDVQLWVALLLKKQTLCKIVAPDWLSEAALRDAYEAELRNKDYFSALPWAWIELGETLVAHAADDLPAPHVVRNLLRDIREVRQAKIRDGIKNLNESYLQMDNVGAMEMNEIRPFAIAAMNEMRAIQETRLGDEPARGDSDDDIEQSRYGGTTDVAYDSDSDGELPAAPARAQTSEYDDDVDMSD
ncbi:DNA replication complex GINS protein PSF2 [Dipodascopsis tothii]|uniref:DNA replication complex GINS protein PSF2 n=1 Tax=Dipodascopsis tothii TaxID=44089 RepID=UPI0034CECBAB